MTGETVGRNGRYGKAVAAAIAAVYLYLEEERGHGEKEPGSPLIDSWRMAARSAGAYAHHSRSWTGRG